MKYLSVRLPGLVSVALQIAALAAALLAVPAQAGSISFHLSLTGDRLTVVNQGSDSAYYPAAYRLLNDGNWQELAPAPESDHAMTMAPGAPRIFIWPDPRPPAMLTGLEATRPVMMRFFDQAGTGFGQISFFNAPPGASEQQRVAARYKDGQVRIKPGKDFTPRASWLIWPQEEGIFTLTAPLTLEHQQPSARRIAWDANTKSIRQDLGRGLPASFLLHETEQGFVTQHLSDGRVQGKQQRTAWLNAHPLFETLAWLLAAAAAALLIWQQLSDRRPGRLSE